MQIDWPVMWEIAKPIFAALVGAYLARTLERRPQLLTYFGHASSFRVKNPNGAPFVVHTHALIVRNAGKKAADNVRITHHTLPDYTVLPDVEVNEVALPGGGKELVIPRMVPGEQVTISYLYYPPLLWSQVHASVRSDEGFARSVAVIPTAQWPAWRLRVFWLIFYVGLVAIVYGLIGVGQLILTSLTTGQG